MQPEPRTPSKANDEIERTKQALSVKWGIQFPERDSIWSPSRRDPSKSEEEKISHFVQFLYFRDGAALDVAINNFERNAINIHSHWVYKPRADAEVIPHNVQKREVFLQRRGELPAAAVKELTESLLHHLQLIADRVKSGEEFSKPAMIDGKIPSSGKQSYDRKAENLTDTIVPSGKGWPPVRSTSSQVETHTPRLKGIPGVIGSHDLGAQHFSSDDYPDSEMADILADDSLLDLSNVTAVPIPQGVIPDMEMDSPVHEDFKTPPTSPLRWNQVDTGLDMNLQDWVEAHQESKSSALTQTATFDLKSSKKRPLEDLEPMPPPPTRKISREQKRDQIFPCYPTPTAPAENFHFYSRSSSSSRSFDNSMSVSSSFTSASPAWTSPNTSFCASSVTTSFDSNSEDTDSTVRPSIAPPTFNAKQNVPWYQHVHLAPNKGGIDTETGHIEKLVDSESVRPNFEKLTAVDTNETATGSVKPSSIVETQLPHRLISHAPFVALPDQFRTISFRQLYEVTRVSLSTGVPLSNFHKCLTENVDEYPKLWTELSSAVSQAKGTSLPEKSSLEAWKRGADGFYGVALSGRLKFLEQPGGPVFAFSLHPLKIEASYRFARKYGHDRFCVIQLPSLGTDGLPSYLRRIQAPARDIIIRWLVETRHSFLGRNWRAFFVKPESTKKSQKGAKINTSQARYRVYLFAEDGLHFRDRVVYGEIDPRIHFRVSVRELLDWHMLPENNSDQTVLKFFNRLGLGLTSTTPTLEFNPNEIIWSDDTHPETAGMRRLDIHRSEELKTGRLSSSSVTPLMNDGCARISRDAALAVANALGMDQAPSVFQGRIGGAKGVWMIDSLDERPAHLVRDDGRVYWIEITESQLKFKPPPIDAFRPDAIRNTFEVNKYSKKLSSSSISFQLIPILEDRGVPREVFKRLLREDLHARVIEMQEAMDDALMLRKWNQDANPVTQERVQYGGIEMEGGLPKSTAERINWFVEHGFEPKTCLFLKDQLWKSIRSYCAHLESRTNIGLGRSTSAFMIADPLGILEEDEVHIGFSSVFRDTKSGFNDSMLHDLDILVARLPAHLPSDIQKVRAVFKPELRVYRDVVVFSSKGTIPLASKLSGGDYDGDTAWICWEPNIVDPFKNAKVPDEVPPDAYGIEKDNTKVASLIAFEDYSNRFLRHAFHFNLQMSMLGICSNYHESLCYHDSSIDSPSAISISLLLGYLVDSAKGGYIFDDARWIDYLRQIGLPTSLQPPAYKARKTSRENRDSLIDQLVFHVAKEEREKALKDFNRRFDCVSSQDADLVVLRNLEFEKAKTNKTTQSVMKNLKEGLESMFNYWKKYAKREDDEDHGPSRRRSSVLSFRSVVEQCREDFLALRPIIDKDIIDQCPDTVRRWQDEHSAGRSSYWDLLKASVAFYHFHRSVSFVWHIAGVELGEIKATKGGRGAYRCVVGDVFNTLKLDGKLVPEARRTAMQMEELRKDKDDSDEFGSDADFMDL